VPLKNTLYFRLSNPGFAVFILTWYSYPEIRWLAIQELLFERKIKMDFERYYLDLFEMLNSCCKKIASGKYDKSDSERLFELSKKGRYPAILAELAESFGMMLVKVEAREFEKSQMIEELEGTKSKLEVYSQKLEALIEEYCPEQSPTD